MAYEAAKRALDDAELKAEDLDLILVATVTPDRSFPSVANMIQDKLGANQAGAFDLAAACAGFIYGLVTGTQFIESGSYKNVLVVGVDKVSKITEDRKSVV